MSSHECYCENSSFTIPYKRLNDLRHKNRLQISSLMIICIEYLLLIIIVSDGSKQCDNCCCLLLIRTCMCTSSGRLSVCLAKNRLVNQQRTPIVKHCLEKKKNILGNIYMFMYVFLMFYIKGICYGKNTTICY